MFPDELTKEKALKFLLLFFIISVLIRLPNLDRPLSKHHEFNAALILIGIESWQQAGGASAFHFIPVMNYQQEGDYSLEKSELTDKNGNYLYMSFGPGWYVIPYLFFEILNLSPTPLNLQILNLLFNAVTVLLLFLLFERIWPPSTKRKYTAVLASSIVFLFSPNILWFFGNGYVCTAIMLPFVLASIIMAISMLAGTTKISPLNLIGLFLIGIITIYIDWFGVFLFGSFGLISLFFIKKNRQIVFFTTICIITVIAGITVITWQFSSYTGLEQLMLYWKNRFNTRSMLQQENSLPVIFYRISAHFVTSYLPVLCLLIFLYITSRVRKERISLFFREKLFISICVIALLPFNLIFLEWTKVHDFSLIPYSLLFSFLAGVLILRISGPINIKILIIAFLILTTSQYLIINRPGRFSQNHSRYSREMDLGISIKELAPAPFVIFTNLPLSPMIEYYAKRKLHNNSNKEEAEKLTRNFNISKSMWIEVKNDSIVQVQVIKN